MKILPSRKTVTLPVDALTVMAMAFVEAVMPAAEACLVPRPHGSYAGDVTTRDAAYHQGTVWPWLAGPFVDAWLRIYPDQQEEVRTFLEGIIAHLDDVCIGSISEVFDAEPPFAPKGCISQAWSVAEVLRAWIAMTRAGEETA